MIQEKNEISQFIFKILDMMTTYQDIISWNFNQTELVIKDLTRLTQELLPKYFRHTKFTSFIRQLNMYSFHKVCREKNTQIHFKNDIFFGGNEANFGKIKRKKKIESNIKFPKSLQQNILYIKQNADIPQNIKQLIILLFDFKNISLRQNKKSTLLINHLLDQIKVSKLKKYQSDFRQIKTNYQELNQKSQQIENIFKQMKSHKNQCSNQLLESTKDCFQQSIINTGVQSTLTIDPSIKLKKKEQVELKNSFKINTFKSIPSFIQFFDQHEKLVKQEEQEDNKSQFSIEFNHNQQ